jgi:hypothetical protein
MTDQPGAAASMPKPPRSSTPRASSPVIYAEQLRTPWWWYLAGVAIAVLLGGEFFTAIPTWIAWIPFGLVLAVIVLGVWRFSSGRVTVTSATIQAGDQVLPLTAIDRAIQLSPTELRRLVGRHSDPTAFNFIRSWVGPGIQLVLLPPAPGFGHPAEASAEGEAGEAPPASTFTPYWAVSTRHPDQLLAALAASAVPVG